MNKNPTDLNANKNLSKIVKERTELEEKIRIAKEKIEEKKKERQDRIELQKLKKEYEEITYPERHPIKYKLKSIFRVFRKEVGELQKKAEDYNKKNPWEI